MIDKSTFDFLADLKKKNRREWYHANKDWFKDSQQNFIDFVAMILFRISEFDPDMIGTEPKTACFVFIVIFVFLMIKHHTRLGLVPG